MAVSAAIRARLAALARSKRTRQTQFTAAMPTRWQPAQVTDPTTRQAFTEDGAWQYIANQLDAGVSIEAIPLEKPPGKTGYVLKLPGANGAVIYVKLQICGDHVRGRSFHLSETPQISDTESVLEVSDAKRTN